ncbi:ORF6N domain-containing protein [Candidatus Arsenophonus triatominarum]|uniref:ORF6N domain-containing protein n=1 Tax=Candidatus Arsenophonus triatominarum TaxID=57911 RepID=UPI000B0251D5|nr:ORF6N domain-containing protein [Candidatus Arsenophonus triatominarum]
MATQITVETIPTITHNEVPVVTTELLAWLYGTETNNIKVNHSRNSDRFVEGKHYFKLEGPELREFKHKVTQSNSVKIAPNVRSLMLWTERGAARHAKMLETDQAWEIFEQLEDYYFHAERTFNTPKHHPEARELLTADDTSHLSRLIWTMANGFRFERSWTQGIWYALRHATGVESPQNFEVNQIPIIAKECEKIYNFTNGVKEAIYEAEKQAVRRVLRKREDADKVLAEMKQLLEESNQEHTLVLTDTLTRWQQAEIQQFLQRR